MRMFGLDLNYRTYRIEISHTDDKGWVAEARTYIGLGPVVKTIKDLTTRGMAVDRVTEWIDGAIDKKCRNKR